MADFPLSRRSLLFTGAGTVGLLVSGCSSEPATREAGTKAGTKAATKAAPTSLARLAPDVAVATTALVEITAVRAAVTSTLARYPASRSQLGPVVTMHRAHEVTLADAVPTRARSSTTAAPYVVPRGRAVALADLLVREQKLHSTLDALALEAQSGEFARLLACMGAGIGQRLTTWSA